jgi:Ras-related protein Rab-7A
MSKNLEIHDAIVSLQIWDTAGQERFHQGTLSSAFYRGAHGALLVYDVNNESSIEQVLQWREECISRLDNDTFFPIVVIGNKVDLRSPDPNAIAVNQGPILSWCRENSYGHIETSAKDGNGVQAAILAITALALEYQRSPNRNSHSLSSQNTVALDKMYEKKSNDVCGASCSMI